jgi:hypothetical protein
VARRPARCTVPGWMFVIGLVLACPAAQAARVNHLFIDESQLVPEGGVELEQWVWSNGRIPDVIDRPASIWVWWAPVVAVSSHLELQLPLQLTSFPDLTYLHSIELVARYRLFPREQDDGLQPLFRVVYGQPLSGYSGPPTFEASAVVTYGNLTSVRLTVNAGARLGLPFLQSSAEGTTSVLGLAGAGVSVPLGKEFRLAAEFLSQFPIHGKPRPNYDQFYLGPSIAWSKGPFWVTFGSLFGLTSDSSRFLPKILWAVQL